MGQEYLLTPSHDYAPCRLAVNDSYLHLAPGPLALSEEVSVNLWEQT